MVCARPWNADLIPPTSGRPYLPRRIHVDKGYRGHSYPNEFRVWISGQVRRVTKIIRREMKRRAAVEPVIGHMKAKHRKAVQLGRLEADRARLVEEVDRLRRERDQARHETSEERDQARQERDRLLGLVEATQKRLEDQSRERKRGWRRLFGGN